MRNNGPIFKIQRRGLIGLLRVAPRTWWRLYRIGEDRIPRLERARLATGLVGVLLRLGIVG